MNSKTYERVGQLVNQSLVSNQELTDLIQSDVDSDDGGIAFGMESQCFDLMEKLLEQQGANLPEGGLRDSGRPEYRALTILIESMGIIETWQLCSAIEYVLEPVEPLVFEPDGIFKGLTETEAQSFKDWARGNYQVGDAIPSEVWHPVTVNECKLMNEEAGLGHDDDDDTAKRNGEQLPFQSWVKRLGQHHFYVSGSPETLCGMPMLGNNYAGQIPDEDLEPCAECFAKRDSGI